MFIWWFSYVLFSNCFSSPQESVSIWVHHWANTGVCRPVEIRSTTCDWVVVAAVSGSSIAILLTSIRAADLSLIADHVWVTDWTILCASIGTSLASADASISARNCGLSSKDDRLSENWSLILFHVTITGHWIIFKAVLSSNIAEFLGSIWAANLGLIADHLITDRSIGEAVVCSSLASTNTSIFAWNRDLSSNDVHLSEAHHIILLATCCFIIIIAVLSASIAESSGSITTFDLFLIAASNVTNRAIFEAAIGSFVTSSVTSITAFDRRLLTDDIGLSEDITTYL